MRWLLATAARVAAIVFVTVAALSVASAQSRPGYQAPDKPKTAEVPIATKAAQGQAPLAKLYGHLKPETSRIKRLPPLSAKAKQERTEKKLAVGVVRTLPSELNPLTDAAVYSVLEGEVRVAAIESQGAVSTRLRFKDFSLPAGARVFVYSATNTDVYFGPYEGRGPWDDGTFWTPSLPGAQVIVEYTSPTKNAGGPAPFKVSEVAHIHKDVVSPNDPAGFCNNDVNAPWTNVAKSVGMLQFVSGGLVFVCTGTLLNDSNTSFDHYVLTANHCINSQSEAQSAQIFWNYNTGDDPTPSTPFSTGANLMVTGSASDFTLLRYGGIIPGLFFSGWDATPFGVSTSVTGIHHPSGSHKRISFGATNSGCTPELPGPCGNFTGVTWSSGTTEGGSSGSGLWTGSGDTATLVGTLWGGTASCQNQSGSDYYGRFSVTYPNVDDFLNGTTTCVTSVSPTSQDFSAAGANGSFTVNASAGCNWTASTTASFITITSGTGNGPGTVNFSVAANNGLLRRGSIVVGTRVFNIVQAGGGACAATPINFGQTISSNSLAPGDCLLDNNWFVDVYSFNGTAGQNIIIAMSSSAIDTFLYLLNPDGSILRINDDADGLNSRIPVSGFLTLPNTGTYTILATSFDPGETGSYSITLTERAKRTLTVQSLNADGAVNITVTPSDTNGANNGTTPFNRSYYEGITVTLNAPGIVGNTEFKEWRRDNVQFSNTNIANVLMSSEQTLVAVYGPIPTFTLTVDSSNPNSGVSVTASVDNAGLGGGVTQFVRTFNRNGFVSLTAASVAPGGNVFQKWQKDGVDFGTGPSIVLTMTANTNLVAFYVAPQTFTLTVNTTNPSSGVPITVSPADKNGAGDGTTSFTRSYFQSTNVTLTAPENAPNGNLFFRWHEPNGNTVTFSRTTNLSMNGNVTRIAEYLTKPIIYAEDGTNNAAAINSVTFLRGPFQILDPRNFSLDGHTRIILFTSDLGLTPADLPAIPSPLVVEGPNYNLPIETVGPIVGVPGLSGSYIIVRLPDGLPTGVPLDIRVRLRQVSSDARKITFAP